MNSTQQEGTKAAVLFLLLLSLLLSSVHADPTGGTITSASTEQAVNQSPGSRQDPRGTITTIVIDALQQDQHWKGYVGNVTGALTLDDADNFTLYDWDLTSVTGNVFASRYGNLTWTSVQCAGVDLITSESEFHNMSATDADRINATYNWTIHKQFTIAGQSLGPSTCSSTVTYLNDTRQVMTTGVPFQTILVNDSNDYLVYATSIDDDIQGFDNKTYDFQLIVAESHIKVAATSYYFYVELV